MGKLPAPGELAPDFELFDSTGTGHRLSESVAETSLVVLFFRGYW
jgi:peroxiredoxin